MSAPRSASKPVALRKEGSEHLVIDWSDGHRGLYAWKHLRAQCPCASCREEREKPPDPFRILTERELKQSGPATPTALTPIGHYAYKITWNDGHDTGIYTLDSLRYELCQCPECRQGDKETRRQGDKETRRQGDKETRRQGS
jgi:DUF971 family protein